MAADMGKGFLPDIAAAKGLEFSSQPFDIPRRQVIERGPMFGAPVVRWLPAKSKIGSRFLFFYTRVPAVMTRIDDVTLSNRRISIEDRATAQRVVLAASLGLE